MEALESLLQSSRNPNGRLHLKQINQAQQVWIEAISISTTIYLLLSTAFSVAHVRDPL